MMTVAQDRKAMHCWVFGQGIREAFPVMARTIH